MVLLGNCKYVPTFHGLLETEIGKVIFILPEYKCSVFLIRKMKAVEFDFFIMKTDPHIKKFFLLQYQFLNHSDGVCFSYFDACEDCCSGKNII